MSNYVDLTLDEETPSPTSKDASINSTNNQVPTRKRKPTKHQRSPKKRGKGRKLDDKIATTGTVDGSMSTSISELDKNSEKPRRQRIRKRKNAEASTPQEVGHDKPKRKRSPTSSLGSPETAFLAFQNLFPDFDSPVNANTTSKKKSKETSSRKTSPTKKTAKNRSRKKRAPNSNSFKNNSKGNGGENDYSIEINDDEEVIGINMDVDVVDLIHEESSMPPTPAKTETDKTVARLPKKNVSNNPSAQDYIIFCDSDDDDDEIGVGKQGWGEGIAQKEEDAPLKKPASSTLRSTEQLFPSDWIIEKNNTHDDSTAGDELPRPEIVNRCEQHLEGSHENPCVTNQVLNPNLDSRESANDKMPASVGSDSVNSGLHESALTEQMTADWKKENVHLPEACRASNELPGRLDKAALESNPHQPTNGDKSAETGSCKGADLREKQDSTNTEGLKQSTDVDLNALPRECAPSQFIEGDNNEPEPERNGNHGAIEFERHDESKKEGEQSQLNIHVDAAQSDRCHECVLESTSVDADQLQQIKPTICNNAASVPTSNKQCDEKVGTESIPTTEPVCTARKEANIAESTGVPKSSASQKTKFEKKAILKKELSPCRNFVVIDCDDDSEDDCFVTAVKPGLNFGAVASGAWSTRAGSSKSRAKPNHQPNGHTRPKKMSTENPLLPDSVSYDFFTSRQAAAEIQDRLFRECAARMQKKVAEDPSFLNSVPSKEDTPSFASPEPLVHKKYPQHWRWKDPYARLGLPRNATKGSAKSHYRKLCLAYHPDKLKPGQSTEPFHAIVAAYRKITCT